MRHHEPPADLKAQDPATLRARLRVVEKDFYWVRHEDRGGQSRADLERTWNDLKAALAPKDRPWVYKHDRRDAFTFTEVHELDGQGKPVIRVTAHGRVRDPRTTICWRTDTKYGKSRYKAVQAAVKRQGGGRPGGDDLGHLIADRFGTDIEGVNAGRVNSKTDAATVRRLNYSWQNGKMNQSAAWHPSEGALARAAGKRPFWMTVVSTTDPARAGPLRERSRTLEAYRGRGEHKRHLWINTPDGQFKLDGQQKVVFANPTQEHAGPRPPWSAFRTKQARMRSLNRGAGPARTERRI